MKDNSLQRPTFASLRFIKRMVTVLSVMNTVPVLGNFYPLMFTPVLIQASTATAIELDNHSNVCPHFGPVKLFCSKKIVT